MEEEARSFWEIGADEGVLHERFPALLQGLEWVSAGIDLFAVLLLVIGAGRFVLGVARSELAQDGKARVRGMNRQRMELGRYILAALELLIVSDIIHTALTLAVADLVFLGLLVVIRSLISYFLDRELGELRQELGEGAPPEGRG
ncbi:MAG TPA: DUF1622 domain-containing protein [Rubellimicrobium sp.]|jgi:uncharacterized membrane protein|nr:DUF1622 domain-containing protein [Rubellimicrobium sp.]